MGLAAQVSSRWCVPFCCLQDSLCAFMSYAMAVEAVREASGFTEEQCRCVLEAVNKNLEDALASLYEHDNKLVAAIRAEGLPPTTVPEFIPTASWHTVATD